MRPMRKGVKHWTDRIKSGESLSVLQQALARSGMLQRPRSQHLQVVDSTAAGSRIVGENGPELEATGSRILMLLKRKDLMVALRLDKQLSQD